jgi:hypothetical protein
LDQIPCSSRTISILRLKNCRLAPSSSHELPHMLPYEKIRPSPPQYLFIKSLRTS